MLVIHLSLTTEDMIARQRLGLLVIRAKDKVMTRKVTEEPDYTAHITRLARKSLPEDRCIFTGFTQGLTKISLFQNCDLFVLPTSQENFGYVYFESLASGTPVITTKGADTWPELSEAGAWIVDQSPEAIADSIRSALANPTATAERGRIGREWVFERLNSDTIGHRFVDAYQSVLYKTGGGS